MKYGHGSSSTEKRLSLPLSTNRGITDSFTRTRLARHDMGCDSYSASTHKWFMGPKESGELYVRRERVDQGAAGTAGALDVSLLDEKKGAVGPL